MPQYLVLHNPITEDNPRDLLGRVVPNVLHPRDSYRPRRAVRLDTVLNEFLVAEPTIADFQQFISSINGSAIRAKIEGALGIATDSKRNAKTEISSREVKTYGIEQVWDAFDRFKDMRIRRTLMSSERENGGIEQHEDEDAEVVMSDLLKPLLEQSTDRRLYWIVGVKTCRDATIKFVTEDESRADANIHLPTSEAMSALGVPNLGRIGNVEGALSVHRKQDTVGSGTYGGEQVFALRYAIIRYGRDWRKITQKPREWTTWASRDLRVTGLKEHKDTMSFGLDKADGGELGLVIDASVDEDLVECSELVDEGLDPCEAIFTAPL